MNYECMIRTILDIIDGQPTLSAQRTYDNLSRNCAGSLLCAHHVGPTNLLLTPGRELWQLRAYTNRVLGQNYLQFICRVSMTIVVQ